MFSPPDTHTHFGSHWVYQQAGWWQLPHRAEHTGGQANICCVWARVCVSVCVCQRWVVNMQIKQLKFMRHTPKHTQIHTHTRANWNRNTTEARWASLLIADQICMQTLFTLSCDEHQYFQKLCCIYVFVIYFDSMQLKFHPRDYLISYLPIHTE